MSYSTAAGSPWTVRRTAPSASFDEQFPALGSANPPVMNRNSSGNRGKNGINSANNSTSSTNSNKHQPLLSQQLEASNPNASVTSPSAQTKANAQAILNAVKHASTIANQSSAGGTDGGGNAGKSSLSRNASGILNNLAEMAGKQQRDGSHTPQLPPGLIPAAPNASEMGGSGAKGNDAFAAAKTETVKTQQEKADEPVTEIDKYGLKALLPLLRQEPSDQTTIAMGIDLNMLGLEVSNTNRESADYKISKSFASPWLETSRSEVEPLFITPESFKLSEADLPNIESKIGTFTDETLFFIFYSKPRDTLQELAARELNSRNWRYHKELQVWLTKESHSEPIPNGPDSERGTYVFFDPTTWQYITKDFILSYQSII